MQARETTGVDIEIRRTTGVDIEIRRTTGVDIEIRRSAKRRRTVSAYRDGDRFIVLVPARMSKAQARSYADELVHRIIKRERAAVPSDSQLRQRASELSQAWLPGAPAPVSVRWVTNQRTRWGSCTTADRTIRLSHRLQGMPDYVVDYVLLHELAHLLVAGHGPDFEALMTPYPRLAEARAFLAGVSHAANSAGDPDSECADQPNLDQRSETPSGDNARRSRVDDPAIGTLF